MIYIFSGCRKYGYWYIFDTPTMDLWVFETKALELFEATLPTPPLASWRWLCIM